MLADPQTVTVNALPKTLDAVERGNMASRYSESTGEHTLKISTTQAKRTRSVCRLDHTKTAADPLTAENAEIGASVYIVIDQPPWGYTQAEVDDLVQGLIAWATSATVLKVIAGQS